MAQISKLAEVAGAAVEAGGVVMAGIYTGYSKRVVKYTDKKGKAKQMDIIAHVIICGGVGTTNAVTVEEILPDGKFVEQYTSTLATGDKVIVLLTSMVTERGTISCRTEAGGVRKAA